MPTAWHGQGWRPQPDVKWGIRNHEPLRPPGALHGLPSPRGLPGQSPGARPRSLKPSTGREPSLPWGAPEAVVGQESWPRSPRVPGSQDHGSCALGRVLQSLRARHSAPPAGATHEGAVGAELSPERGQAWSRGDSCSLTSTAPRDWPWRAGPGQGVISSPKCGMWWARSIQGIPPGDTTTREAHDPSRDRYVYTKAQQSCSGALRQRMWGVSAEANQGN